MSIFLILKAWILLKVNLSQTNTELRFNLTTETEVCKCEYILILLENHNRYNLSNFSFKKINFCFITIF